VQTATGQAGAEPQAELSLKGTLEGQPLSLHFVGGSVLMLRETEKPYPVDLHVAYGDTELTIKGSLQDPIQFKGGNFQLRSPGRTSRTSIRCSASPGRRRRPIGSPAIRCFMGRLVLDHGLVTFDKTIMDTRKSVLHFDGKAALLTQAVKAKITADPKQFDLLDLHAPVLIGGKIRKPAISIGRKIPIPTPDFGGAKDVACEERIHELLLARP
jgi:hypothetical protein